MGIPLHESSVDHFDPCRRPGLVAGGTADGNAVWRAKKLDHKARRYDFCRHNHHRRPGGNLPALFALMDFPGPRRGLHIADKWRMYTGMSLAVKTLIGKQGIKARHPTA